jgi:thioredoxin-like negative regulator of GroEL
MNITPLSIDTYSEFIKSARVVLIHCGAEWNQNLDNIVTKYLIQAAGAHHDNVRLGFIDTDRAEFLPFLRGIGVRNIPIVIYYKDGTLVEREAGLMNARHVENKVNNLLES